MRSVAIATVAVSAFRLADAACSVVSGVQYTFYGWGDNDPPGDGTAYNCGGRNFHAGGVGTYDNPLTFATASWRVLSVRAHLLPVPEEVPAHGRFLCPV